MRWLAMLIFVGLMPAAGTQPRPAFQTSIQATLLSRRVPRMCSRWRPSAAKLLYDAEHGQSAFRPVGAGTPARAARLEIGRGEPLQALI